MQEPSKDNSGEKIYVRGGVAQASPPVKFDSLDSPDSPDFLDNIDATDRNVCAPLHASDAINTYRATPSDTAEYRLDAHGHLIVKHDLFNHDGCTQDGIAEAFIEFAKKERLSFF